MKTFFPKEWENVHSKDNIPQKSANSGLKIPTLYNNKSSDDKFEAVERVVRFIETNGIDIAPDYSTWLNVGFALVDNFGESGREYYHRISKFYPDYNATETDKQYNKCLASKGSGITIATFYKVAKDAGVDISSIKDVSARADTIAERNAKSSSLSTAEIPDQASGSLDYWIFGSKEQVKDNATETNKTPNSHISQSGTTTEIQKTKNPKNKPAITGSKWIKDEDDLPSFPQEVYDHLPTFFKDIIEICPPNVNRDMILMGSIACLSSTFDNLVGEYNNGDCGPMIDYFHIAAAGMGKGPLIYCRQLVAPISQELLETSRQQIEEYKVAKEQAMQGGSAITGEEPHRRMLIIPTNSSASAIIEQLDNNDGVGLIFDTEIDVLCNILKTEFGDYTTIIRKAFHHEPIDMNRRTNSEYRSIDHPKLAVCMSGTFDQLQTLTPSADDGTYSRFTCYYMPFKVEFGNVLRESLPSADGSFISVTDKYYQLGLRFKQMRETFLLGGNYRFVVPQRLCNIFIAHFSAMNIDTVEDISNDMQSIVRRLAFSIFRFMMLFTAIRFMDNTPDLSTQERFGNVFVLRYNEEDFNTAMAMGDTLIYHTAFCYTHLPKHRATVDSCGRILSKADKKNILYEALPARFDISIYAEKAYKCGYKVSTAKKWINEYIIEGRLERPEQNIYYKLLAD